MAQAAASHTTTFYRDPLVPEVANPFRWVDGYMVDWDELDRLGAKVKTGEQWADVCRLEDLLRSQGQLQFNFITRSAP